MPHMEIGCTRRQALGAIAAAMAAGCGRAAATASPGAPRAPRAPEEALASIEVSLGGRGRAGVFALDTGSGRALGRREDERFAMCSTFKWLLAAAVFARADRGEIALEERLPYGRGDLFEYAPVTSAHVADGAMTVEDLARAAVTVSDNTAANLLLAKLGGPAAVTDFARGLGDPVTRLDRNEPALNDNDPGDPRDTTSPRAMVGLLRAVLTGDALARPSRERLLGLLRDCETGRQRLRAGLPASWTVGDKTGTGLRGACNDVAIATPPGRAPILVAAFLSDGAAEKPQLEAALAAVGRRVGAQLG